MVFVGKSAMAGDIHQRRIQPVAHEFNIALGGFAGDFKFFRKGFGVGIPSLFYFVLKPEKSFQNDF